MSEKGSEEPRRHNQAETAELAARTEALASLQNSIRAVTRLREKATTFDKTQLYQRSLEKIQEAFQEIRET